MYTIKNKLTLYVCILLALLSPSRCIKYIQQSNFSNDGQGNIYNFRTTFLEAFIVTFACIFIGYLLAGLPSIVSWSKIIPTFLLALPVYDARFAVQPTWTVTIEQKMDQLFFKSLYVVAITWLAWDISKGII